jgi:hypothetical protein
MYTPRIWIVLCVLSFSFIPSATAREPFRVGTLTCDTSARVGLVLGSRQELRCVFLATNGRRYIYRGFIRRLGLDIGITRGGTLLWRVFARNSGIGEGTIRGSYVGASGNIALGLGLGAKLLIGGSRRSMILQPLSVEGLIGINLAAGVANLVLR